MSDSPRPAAPDLLRLLLEQARDHALILLDPSGTVVGWLAGAEHVLGYTAEEMLGQPLDILFTPEDRGRSVPGHELLVASAEGRAEDDRWLVRKDGTRIWVYGVVTALRGPAGEVVGFGKVLRDRTDVRAQLDTLENRAEALAKVNRRKDVFLGTLAHELRNPLSPLTHAVQLLEMTAGGGEDAAFAAGVLKRQLAQLVRLVDDLMDVTRISAGKVSLVLQEVDLNEVLARAAESCRPDARGAPA